MKRIFVLLFVSSFIMSVYAKEEFAYFGIGTLTQTEAASVELYKNNKLTTKQDLLTFAPGISIDTFGASFAENKQIGIALTDEIDFLYSPKETYISGKLGLGPAFRPITDTVIMATAPTLALRFDLEMNDINNLVSFRTYLGGEVTYTFDTKRNDRGFGFSATIGYYPAVLYTNTVMNGESYKLKLKNYNRFVFMTSIGLSRVFQYRVYLNKE